MSTHILDAECKWTPLKESGDLRYFLNKKRANQNISRKAKLAGVRLPHKKSSSTLFKEAIKSYGDGFVPYPNPFPFENPCTTIASPRGLSILATGTAIGASSGWSGGKDYTQAEMDEVNDKLKNAEMKLAASTDEIEGLRRRLEEAEKRATFAEAELEEFKTVGAFFLADFITDVDNIMPDDLEYGLTQFEKRIEETVSTFSRMPLVDTNKGWVTIFELCKSLGMKHTNGYTDTQDIKVFIKEAVRACYLLEKENVELSKKLLDADVALGDTLAKILELHERRRR